MINLNDVFRFLHVGEPAPRKGGQNVLDAFTKLFGNGETFPSFVLFRLLFGFEFVFSIGL